MRVLGESFHADGNVASAGGCLASPLLAAWVICRLAGRAAAETALGYVAPVGERDAYIAGVLDTVAPFSRTRRSSASASGSMAGSS